MVGLDAVSLTFLFREPIISKVSKLPLNCMKEIAGGRFTLAHFLVWVTVVVLFMAPMSSFFETNSWFLRRNLSPL